MPPSLELACTASACASATATDEWESVFAAGEASPGPDQYWLMGGDVDDTTSLNKVLQCDLDFNANANNAAVFGNADAGFAAAAVVVSCTENLVPTTMNPSVTSGLKPWQNFMFAPMPNGIGPPVGLNNQQQPPSSHQQMLPFDQFAETKHPVFGPQLLTNQHQAHHPQNSSFFLPTSYAQQGQSIAMLPQPKRHNPGPIGGRLEIGTQQQQPQQGVAQGHSFSQQQQQQQQQQQAIIDQLYKVADLVQTGNLVLAQGILARLNHQLSPIGKPFLRASFYFKEALLQLLLHSNNNMNPSATINSSPFSLVFKIGAYKSLSDVSPVVQFANFTCNQAMLEALEGFDSIHVIDFDIGYGGQWASFMQELSLRSGGAPSLRITAFASPSTHDQLELGLVRENLIQFATEINTALEFDILSVDSLTSGGSWSLHHHVSENEAIAVNLPVSSFSNCQLSLPLVLRFVKQLSPKVVVSVDRGCDRTDLPFPNHVIHALQSYSNLLESLDAVNVNLDALQKIERFLVQPGIEKIITGRYLIPEKTQHWRTLFLSSGLSPLTLSNLTETLAEFVVKRTQVRGFHVEKRQASLVLCWQRRELISASAWRC